MAETAKVPLRSDVALDVAVPGSAAVMRHHAASPRLGVAPLSVMVIIALGLILRIVAALTLSPHVDEPSSLLAAHAVAEQGVPILPSGTVYFQGATLSYLLQPFIWLGVGDLHDLHTMRLLIAAAGAAALYLCYRVGWLITGDSRVGLAMAGLVAFDPLSVQWSGHLRMYGLLQVFTLGLVWAFILLLVRGATVKLGMVVAALFWLAVFTHVGAAIMGLAMGATALIVHGRDIMRQGKLLLTLAVSAAAPVALLGLNRALGTSSVSLNADEGGSGSALTFVGDNLLQPLARFRIDPKNLDWGTVIQAENLFWSAPGLIVAIAAVIGSRGLRRHRPDSRITGIGVTTLLAFYGFPMVVVGVFTVSPKERYLLNAHILGYLFLAFLLVRLGYRVAQRRMDRATIVRLVAATMTLLVIASALTWRLNETVVHPDHNAALAWVADRHADGQPVIVALPAIAQLAFDERAEDDLYFLAGPQDQTRAGRYTRITDDNRLIDYWIGVESIVRTEDLARLLRDNPDAWVVVDQHRLDADWAYQGPMERTLDEFTYPVKQTDGGALVFRALPQSVPNAPATPNVVRDNGGIPQILP